MSEKLYCGVCGREYSSVGERAKCEATCLEKQRKEAEANRKVKLEQEKEIRWKAVTDAFDVASKQYNTALVLKQKYYDDYHEFETYPSIGKMLESVLNDSKFRSCEIRGY